jgi:hypothetical protein
MLSFVLCACKPAQEGQLQPGELREEFAGWKILFYSEGLEPGRPAAPRGLSRGGHDGSRN